jgi:hypothetical protein
MTATTRRGLLVLAAGAPLLLAAPAALADGNANLTILEDGMKLKQLIGLAYTTLAAEPRLDRKLRELLTLFAGHEREHAAALLKQAEYLGGPPAPEPTRERLARVFPSLSTLRDARAALGFVTTIERGELQAFYAAQHRLDEPRLLQLAASVMCSDAQHLALAREAIGVNPIPSAFESGQTR